VGAAGARLPRPGARVRQTVRRSGRYPRGSTTGRM